MSDDIDKNKWDSIEKQLTKKEQQLPQPSSNPLAAHVVDGGTTQPRGLIEKFKNSKIERDQRIQVLTEKTRGQLEVWKHHVESQVVVAKQRIDLHVEAQLMEIGRQHLLN